MGSLQSVNLDAMLRNTFIPDYTVRAITEVFYVRIKRSLYLAAKRATLMERAKKDTQSEDHFDDEVEKVSIFRVSGSCSLHRVFCGHAVTCFQLWRLTKFFLNYCLLLHELISCSCMPHKQTEVKTVISVV
jgi:hypothetical protein